jgi:hypothetical protein
VFFVAESDENENHLLRKMTYIYAHGNYAVGQIFDKIGRRSQLYLTIPHSRKCRHEMDNPAYVSKLKREQSNVILLTYLEGQIRLHNSQDIETQTKPFSRAEY